MKTALLTGLLTIASTTPAFAALNCKIQSRAFALTLSVQSVGDGLIAGTYSNGEGSVAFEGKHVGSEGPTSTYALEGGRLTSLEVTETAVPSPEPRPCPRCAGMLTFKTTAKLLGAGVAPTYFSKCSGTIE